MNGTNRVFELHDKARPHSMAATVEAVRQLKFELLPSSHPPTRDT